jgi:3-methyladenine DNA glycosylase AlkD
MTYQNLSNELEELKNPSRAKISQRFFKTGKGQYGEGDVFLGLDTATMVKTALKYGDLPLFDLQKLLQSPIHECRAAALVILKRQFQKADVKKQEQIQTFYLTNAHQINNWDLVDISAPLILAGLTWSARLKLARSENLWERRMAMMSTFELIKQGQFDQTLKLAKFFLTDSHDLIHKAVGWLLREVGKRNLAAEMAFLEQYASQMPRVMLRYALEKLPAAERQYYLKIK